MSAKTMAEVLAEHRISAHFTCECGEDFYPDEEDLDEERADEPDGFIKAYEGHQADALTAAGFGLVADAKAEALEEAADWLRIGAPEDQDEGTISLWLRDRAKTERTP